MNRRGHKRIIAAAVVVMLAGPARAARAQANEAGETVPLAGLVAHLHRPVASGRTPAVLLLGGSGGGIGWQDYIGELLAKRGIAALAVGYFAMEGLPKELERIPLEPFGKAIDWLRAQPFVDRDRIGIGGVSKGGELALLLASMHPELTAVATFVPSGIVFQSIAAGFPKTSSWTVGGRDVPFVAYGTAAADAPTSELYLSGIRAANASDLEAATIKVENIHGPILLLTGKADNLWASAILAERIVGRLKAKGLHYTVEHVPYEDAGHLISSIRDDDVTRRGGTTAGNAFAQRDGQKRFLEFFDQAWRK